jgi:2-polyprenyl-3-methyl-5-hydroxy-6-metoxy-1,4-benzoquinol methylase
MELRTRLQEHLAEHDIPCFGERHNFERWAKEKLGHRWREKLHASYGRLNDKRLSREDVRKVFDSCHTNITRVNLSGMFATVLNVGDAITRLITGRKRVLDLGCNIGHLTTWYARAEPARHVTGVDFSPSCIQVARSQARRLCLTNVEFQTADVEACKLPGTYDAIVDSQCLIYVKRIEKVLRHLASLLGSNGLLVTTNVTLGTRDLFDPNSRLRATGLIVQHIQTANFSYLGRQLGCSILVAGKQSAGPCPVPGRVTVPSLPPALIS